MSAIEQYNALFTGQLNFTPARLEDLPLNTRDYVKHWVVGPFKQGKILLHQPVIDGEYLFKIDHPRVGYLVSCDADASHIWADQNFDNMDNNLALSELSSTLTGLPVVDFLQAYRRLDTIKSN